MHVCILLSAMVTRLSVTCDQVSLFSFRGGKERLIQLLDCSSAAPLLKYLSARMSVMPSPDKNEPSKITGSCLVSRNYTRHKQREFTCSAVQYCQQKYGLFCKTRPPVSFVMSKFQKQNLVKVPFHFVSQQKTRRFWCGVGCTALLKLIDMWHSCLIPSVAQPKHLSHGIRFYECILFVHL